MARTVRIVRISYPVLEVLDVDPGHWCGRCLLPSVSRIVLAVQQRVDDALRPLQLSTGWRCDDCGWCPAPVDED